MSPLAVVVALALAAPVGIGQPARDRDFELTANSVDCGATVTDLAPQGQFCLVKVSARNVAGRSLRFTLSVFRQSAFAPDGTRYTVDAAATENASDGKNPFVVPVNPGNSVSGMLVFDIPASSSVAKLKLCESVISPCIEVVTATAR